MSLLHLNDETASILGHTIDIKHRSAVAIAIAQILTVQILNILNLPLAVIEKGVEKTDKQILVHLRTEQLLEAEVGIWVYESLPCIVCHKQIPFKFQMQRYK